MLHASDVFAANFKLFDSRGMEDLLQDKTSPYTPYSSSIRRWEELRAKGWKVVLEATNEKHQLDVWMCTSIPPRFHEAGLLYSPMGFAF